eukprot:TRINITY_DN2801_c0_g3_i1.p1 TRINITY_DN2801_c0_g3~~TRINITY_DN2801_c0_g3_i1.p1  ORF type:complete len:172 (+),score=3.16 TRINITY_DN2801_c0_g3_i1:33-548(+)
MLYQNSTPSSFCDAYVNHRDLHYPLRRQRQMCIRDRDNKISIQQQDSPQLFVEISSVDSAYTSLMFLDPILIPQISLVTSIAPSQTYCIIFSVKIIKASSIFCPSFADVSIKQISFSLANSQAVSLVTSLLNLNWSLNLFYFLVKQYQSFHGNMSLFLLIIIIHYQMIPFQ